MEKIDLVKVIWNYLHLGSVLEKCDCIIGLGSHDLKVPERCADLFKAGYADIIIFAGGYGKITKELWNVSEAEKFAEIAQNLGVPKEKIYIESGSTNTGDNFRFTKKLIDNNNLKINSFLIVCKPYMERRSFASFSAILPDKKCIVTSPNISFDEYLETLTVPQDEFINLLVGDLQRIKIYPQRGWQIPQDIPNEVWQAYEQLTKLGFNKYIIAED